MLRDWCSPSPATYILVRWKAPMVWGNLILCSSISEWLYLLLTYLRYLYFCKKNNITNSRKSQWSKTDFCKGNASWRYLSLVLDVLITFGDLRLLLASFIFILITDKSVISLARKVILQHPKHQNINLRAAGTIASASIPSNPKCFCLLRGTDTCSIADIYKFYPNTHNHLIWYLRSITNFHFVDFVCDWNSKVAALGNLCCFVFRACPIVLKILEDRIEDSTCSYENNLIKRIQWFPN